MRIRGLIFVPLVLALFLLGACSEKSSSNDQRQQQAQDIAKLERELSTVTGMYEGRVTFSQGHAPEDAKLTLYLAYVQDGVNPDGTVRVRPVLKGHFNLVEYLMDSDGLILGGDFNGLNGALTLSSESGGARTAGGLQLLPNDAPNPPAPSGSTTPASTLTLVGTATGESVTLSLLNQTGAWGTFAGKLTSKVASTTAIAWEEERMRRERVVAKVIGRYSNTIRNINPRYRDYKCGDIVLNRVEYDSQIGRLPGLGGYFAFTKLYSSGIGIRSLNVAWRPIDGQFTVTSTSALPLDGHGTLIGKTLEISLDDKFGHVGEMTATMNSEPRVCTTERDQGID